MKPLAIILLGLLLTLNASGQVNDFSFEQLKCEDYLGKRVSKLIKAIPYKYDDVTALTGCTGTIARVTFWYKEQDVKVKVYVDDYKHVKNVFLLRNPELDVDAYLKEKLSIVHIDKSIGRRNRLCSCGGDNL